jgi:NhaP-type Na+/H+ or K+/H+ antiporter
MYAIDDVFGAWILVAIGALIVPLAVLVGEWALKPLLEWLKESEAAISSSVEELVASSQNPISSTRS